MIPWIGIDLRDQAAIHSATSPRCRPAEFTSARNTRFRCCSRPEGGPQPLPFASGSGIVATPPHLLGNRSGASRDDTRCDLWVSRTAITGLALVVHGLQRAPPNMDRGETLELVWTERGRPAVAQTETEGFGTKLGKLTVEKQFRGEIIRIWDPKGLVVRLIVPKDRLLERIGASAAKPPSTSRGSSSADLMYPPANGRSRLTLAGNKPLLFWFVRLPHQSLSAVS